MLTVEERFWNKVDRRDPDECWEWTGAKDRKGYGRIWVNGKKILSHRMSYIIQYGKINPDMCVIHSCDNPGCVNFLHLREGTNLDNIADKVLRCRTIKQKGELNYNAKLTLEQVREIRTRYIPYRVTLVQLAKEYGVSDHAIEHIIYGDRWKE